MKLALGTAQFGLDYGIANNNGQVAISEVKNILGYAKEKGILTLDTASGYGNSEQILGGFGVDDYKIITKTIPLKNGVNGVIKAFHQSLDNLNVDQVYGLLIHNIVDTKDKMFGDLLNKLNKLKEEGVINKIGFSIYTPHQVGFLLKNFDFDLIQLPFNILDRRMIDSGMLALLHSKDIEIHARSVFLQGLLLMSEKNRPNKFNRWSSLWNIWHKWLNDNKITALEATIRHTISVPEISKVFFGVDSFYQLKEIFIASSGTLPKIPDELYTDDSDLLNPMNWRKSLKL